MSDGKTIIDGLKEAVAHAEGRPMSDAPGIIYADPLVREAVGGTYSVRPRAGDAGDPYIRLPVTDEELEAMLRAVDNDPVTGLTCIIWSKWDEGYRPKMYQIEYAAGIASIRRAYATLLAMRAGT